MSVLYIVPTPIGNLGDLTLRAIETLKSVDFIAAEDTRVSAKLLHYLEIRKPLLSCYEHNELRRSNEIIARLQAGESCALVTDAGTPAISDPGEVLVQACIAAGVTVVPLPGPCAAVCALSACGLPTGRFCFEGFLSVNKKSRRIHLAEIKNETRTMIFYEAPHKLAATLRDLYQAFGEREITLCRELTKIHEEFIRTTLSQAVERYPLGEKIRGEFVLIVRGAALEEQTVPDAPDTDDVRQAIAAAKETGMRRNAAYRAALAKKREGTHEA